MENYKYSINLGRFDGFKKIFPLGINFAFQYHCKIKRRKHRNIIEKGRVEYV